MRALLGGGPLAGWTDLCWATFGTSSEEGIPPQVVTTDCAWALTATSGQPYAGHWFVNVVHMVDVENLVEWAPPFRTGVMLTFGASAIVE